jgi:hypothetical protein
LQRTKTGPRREMMRKSEYQESAERGLDADGGPLLPDGHEVPCRGTRNGDGGGCERVGRRGGVVGGL